MRNEISEEERTFVEECEAAYEANPNELHTWEEVVAYVKRKKPPHGECECAVPVVVTEEKKEGS